jgi:hypothetical protein
MLYCSLSLTHSLTHTHTHTLTHTHTHSHSRTHSLTHTLSHAHSLTHTLSHAHSLTHIHTLTHAHTHTPGSLSVYYTLNIALSEKTDMRSQLKMKLKQSQGKRRQMDLQWSTHDLAVRQHTSVPSQESTSIFSNYRR